MVRMNIYLTKERDEKLQRLKKVLKINSKEDVVNFLIDEFNEYTKDETII